MEKQAALVMAMFVTIVAGAQPSYTKVYLAGGTAKMNLNQLPSDNLLVGLSWGPGVSIVDPEGNIVQSSHYWSDTILVQQSVRKYSDNEFYFVSGYHKDSCSMSGTLTIPHTYPLIGKMDSLGNVLALRYYDMDAENCWNLASDLEITNDASVITWGGGGSGIQWSFFALKADSLGGVAWAHHFQQHGSFQFVKELPGGDLLAGINMDTAGVVVARMDANGSFLWCKSYVRPKGMIHDCLIESDSSFIITGITDSIGSTNGFDPLPADFQPKLFMMKLNGSGDVQWCKGYDTEPNFWYARGGSRIIRTQDGNYTVLANLGMVGYDRPFRPLLMKTNLNGDTLWTRSYGAAGYTYSTADLIEYSDGGLLYDGIVYGVLPDGWSGAPYILKVDSLGHVPCNEQRHPVVVLDLFPSDSSFTLASVDGATMTVASVRDTMFAPLAVYDGCVITTIIEPARSSNFRIYPNPNTGHFTVQFADPLMAESYYSVYDTMGRLLFQRPLPKGKETEEVDLSRYSKGTYVIKFTSPEGVCFERVVLE